MITILGVLLPSPRQAPVTSSWGKSWSTSVGQASQGGARTYSKAHFFSHCETGACHVKFGNHWSNASSSMKVSRRTDSMSHSKCSMDMPSRSLGSLSGRLRWPGCCWLGLGRTKPFLLLWCTNGVPPEWTIGWACPSCVYVLRLPRHPVPSLWPRGWGPHPFMLTAAGFNCLWTSWGYWWGIVCGWWWGCGGWVGTGLAIFPSCPGRPCPLWRGWRPPLPPPPAWLTMVSIHSSGSSWEVLWASGLL